MNEILKFFSTLFLQKISKMNSNKSMKKYQTKNFHNEFSIVTNHKFWSFKNFSFKQINCHVFAMKFLIFEKIEIFKIWQRSYDVALKNIIVWLIDFYNDCTHRQLFFNKMIFDIVCYFMNKSARWCFFKKTFLKI